MTEKQAKELERFYGPDKNAKYDIVYDIVLKKIKALRKIGSK